MPAAHEPHPAFPYRMVATDLDGTLLRSDDTVSDRTYDALRRAADAGAAHVVVTGRTVPWTLPILRDLDYHGLAVCAQGAQIYHAGEQRLVASVTLDRGLARWALSRIETEVGPLALAVSRDGVAGEVVASNDYRKPGEGEFTANPLPYVAMRDRSELWDAPLSKVYVQHPDLDDDELAEVATRVAGDVVGVVMSGPGVVELLPPGLTKATGLTVAAGRLGVLDAPTIAFGDMPNDIPMLDWASHAVAMGNAHPATKAVAHEVTASNDDDGIALVLERALDRTIDDAPAR